MKEWRSSG